MSLSLDRIVADFARGMADADGRQPRSKQWQPGLGPHDEKDLIRLVVAEMARGGPGYASHRFEVEYPDGSRLCDICLGEPVEWAVEAKALRMLGDNGKPAAGRDDVSKILSPYDSQHSALTDCTKILSFDAQRRAVLIYAWDFSGLDSQRARCSRPGMVSMELVSVIRHKALTEGVPTR